MGPTHPAPPPQPNPALDCYIKAGQGPRGRADPALSNLVEMGGMSREDWQRQQQRVRGTQVFAYVLSGFVGAFVLIGLAVAFYGLARQFCG